jgi:4a-hydroxytetrahydrobiopterin dehydratase
MARLSDAEIVDGLAGGEWRREGDAIVRERRFADFRAAIAFVERVAEAAEEVNHHPDILVHDWNKVRLTLSTHAEGGITSADLALAERLETL